ncbi:unnamed protein product [Pocillopora meandrina]|uniref:Uncharacterized protein n=1 Tax=Pocillopora meandrina TaxID=46732 RepID=A0AAU9X9Y6_9CNID|nr:unnamed protein product [Pocillopora meandrina]
MSDTLPIFDLRTHRGALTFPDQVNAYLSKEVQLGRIAGPFNKALFMQGFVLSPLNTVEKRDSEERRSIVDLSWPSEKACPPSPVMICLSVELNTDALTLSVSPGRLCELEQLLEQWIHKRTAAKAALQSLVGKLIFISKCVRQSRIFIARILILLRKGLFNHHHVNLTAESRKDIAWWRRFLRAYNGVSIISTAQWSSPGEVFTTDACLTGCGGLCGD